MNGTKAMFMDAPADFEAMTIIDLSVKNN